MATKKSAKKSLTVSRQLTSLDRLVRSGFQRTERRFKQIDRRFGQVDRHFERVDRRLEQVDRKINVLDIGLRDVRKEMNERFAVMEDRIDRLATHVDGFMKLHETLDIEFRVMKQQMERIEERLKRVEEAQAS